MNFCYECGRRLIKKQYVDEGDVDYCMACQKFIFPIFNSAISAIILSPDLLNVLLIQQYQQTHNILVAGYVSKGESVEETLVREIKEEVGLDVKKYYFNQSRYFAKSNTLIHNFVVVVKSNDFIAKQGEVDSAKWFKIEDVGTSIKNPSLAKEFFNNFNCNFKKERLK